jgi:hypothetical protein
MMKLQAPMVAWPMPQMFRYNSGCNPPSTADQGYSKMAEPDHDDICREGSSRDYVLSMARSESDNMVLEGIVGRSTEDSKSQDLSSHWQWASYMEVVRLKQGTVRRSTERVESLLHCEIQLTRPLTQYHYFPLQLSHSPEIQMDESIRPQERRWNPEIFDWARNRFATSTFHA